MQNTLIDYLDRQFAAIARWSIAHRFSVILFSLFLLGSGIYLMSQVRFDGSLAGFFEKSDPAYEAYVEYLDDFLSDEITYILYRVPDSEYGPFDLEAMRTIAELTRVLELEVPFVRDATSLANVEFMHADGEDLIVEELLSDFPQNQKRLLEIKETVMSKPIYVNYLINEQGNYGAIYLEMSVASPDPLEKTIHDPEKGEALENLYPQASDIKVREILKRPEFANSGIEFFLSGDVPMNSAYNQIFARDSALISLYTLGLIALISFALLKTSWAGLLGPVTVVILSVIMMMGVVGLLGWTVGLFITMAPSLICAIGVAQAVHILQEYHRSLARRNDKALAVEQAIRKVGGPCLLAALTTAAGFLVMSVSNLQGLAEFGSYAAIGVMFSFFLSITLLVVFLAGGRQSGTGKTRESGEPDSGDLQGVNPLVGWLVETAIFLNRRFPKLILAFFAIVFVWALGGISRLNIDFDFLKEFKPHVEWRQHTELADQVMGGVMSVTYIIDTGKENGVKKIELLKAIDRVQQFAESIPEVKKTFAVTDIVKDLNRSFNYDNDDFYTIPEDQNLVSQYLLVYEISGGEELPELVNLDFSRTVLELRVIMTKASRMRAIIDQIDGFVAANPLPGAEVRPTGIGWLWVRICDYIARTQMLSYSLIFVIVGVVLCIAYGSVRVGLLAMIPNITPVVITLGAMGWLGINLDYMKLLLATIAIGIAVDDTIHLVTRFRSRFYALGNYSDALTAALRDVGPALVITTFILLGGFAAYLITDMAVLSHFGILLAATLLSALIADLLLMPLLMSTFRPLGPETKAHSAESEAINPREAAAGT